MSEKEYILFCDESDQRGLFYSNFYGGLIVGASQYERITQRLNEKKAELNLMGEVKWEKVTHQYLAKYQELIRLFFEEVFQGHVRMRIMFRQNAHQPQDLTEQQIDMEYFLLYYQFVKHAFGLEFIPPSDTGTRIRLYFDQFPDTREKAEQFKGFLLGLRKNPKFHTARIILSPEDITEVRSHEHVLVQCLDIVLGSMSFRLNDKHKQKPVGQWKRGKRTIAKEALYHTILEEIYKIHPHFNIGISTSIHGELSNRWTDPYMHWKFIPTKALFDATLTKPHPKHTTKNPT